MNSQNQPTQPNPAPPTTHPTHPTDPIDPTAPTDPIPIPSAEPGTRTPEPESRSPNRHTALGSPCSPAWDAAHVAKVEAVEARLNRRICGARNLAGQPCTVDPSHENGRCRFHGGFNLTGAQPGNRNGVIHGLYARSIQTCGEHCPMWKSCPCAGPDVVKLEARERPQCPYETAQYNAVLTDALARVDEMPQAGQMTRYAAHHVAMLQVMTMRAAGAMAVNPMVDMQLVTAKDYRKTDPKVSIYIQAYLRLSAELRRFIKSLETKTTTRVELPKQHDHLRRASHDTSLLPEDQAEIHEHRLPTMQRAFPVLRDASYEARNGSKKKARELLDKAKQIDTSYIANLLDPLGPFWDTTYESLLPLTKGP